MFKKQKTVQSLCESFTSELDLINKANTDKATKLNEEIAEKERQLRITQKEVSDSSTAIANIKKLFGQS